MFSPFPYAELLRWYAQNGRHSLPWRKTVGGESSETAAYRVWLSEILLQQTQAARGAAFFERIVERFPTVGSLARTDYETFFPYYDGLGYYSRARNLLAAAKVVAEKWGGKFPSETEKLRGLPGVWPYTAEAIRAFAFGIPTLSFDTNLEKVFSRYYFGSRRRKLSRAEKAEILDAFVGTGFSSKDVNAALMDYANAVSANAVSKVDWNGNHLSGCRFFESRGKFEDEPKRAPKRFPIKDAVLVAVLADAHGKTLYSAESKDYAPFFVSPPEDRDPRECIKTVFFKEWLSVSVRPPYAKGFLDGAPLAFFRVRVQTGSSKYGAFPKAALAEWWKRKRANRDTDFEVPPA